MFSCALSSVSASSSPALRSGTLYSKFSGNGSLKINWCTLCCMVMSQAPLKWVEKSPPISKGFEAGPEHTETAVNFTLRHKDAPQVSGMVAGTAKGLTPCPAGRNSCQGGGEDRARVRLPDTKWQPASTASMLQPCLWQARLRQCRRTRKKIICPSSKWVQMFSLGKSSNCEVIPRESTFTWRWEWRGRYT